MSTKNTTTSAALRFKNLYSCTREVCTIDPQVSYASIVQRKAERWDILLDFWQKNSYRAGKNVFLNVLSHIFTGEYLTHKKEKTLRLFLAIEEVLLNDSEAFDAWVPTKVFQAALYAVLIKKFLGQTFAKFQIAQGMLRLLEGKSIANFRQTRVAREFDFLKITNMPILERRCSDLKEKIKVILPESQHWKEDQWANQAFVCTSIANTYDIDCESVEEYLQDILELIEFAGDRDVHLRIDNVVYADLNYGFMQAIFKDETDSVILYILSDLIPCIRGGWIDETRIGSSWVYSILREWAYDDGHMYHTQAKHLMFNLTMQYNI